MAFQFQVQILSNNVECLDKNVKAMFQQFLTLQEFIQQEFGPKFSDFCNSRLGQPPRGAGATCHQVSNHSQTTHTSNASKSQADPSTRRTLPPSFSRGMVIKDVSSVSPMSGSSSQDTSHVPDPTATADPRAASIKPELFYNETNDSSDASGDDDECFFVEQDEILEDVEHSGTNAGQEDEDEEYIPDPMQKRKDIHSKYAPVNKEDPKTKMRCCTCGQSVSPRLNRLKDHLEKCPGPDPKIKAKKVTGKDRHVRENFKRVKVGGYIKCRCLHCGQLCSDKLDRLRVHFYTRCAKVNAKENNGKNDNSSSSQLNSDMDTDRSQSNSQPSTSETESPYVVSDLFTVNIQDVASYIDSGQ